MTKEKTNRITQQIKRKGRWSISFSISYVRVCEWAAGTLDRRPTPEELDLAEVHAERIGDPYILDAITKVREEWQRVDRTPTPMLPPAPSEGLREATKPYVVGFPSTVYRVFKRPLTDTVMLDRTLSHFLRDIKAFDKV